MLYTGIKKVKDLEERKRIIDKLIVLRKQLDRDIPEKTAENSLLLATWNIREFGDNRRTESLYYISEIISRFDLIALQEVASDKKGLESIVSILGKDWQYIVTDSTEGSEGGWECMAFLYDTRKVSFKNLAGEIVLEKKKLIDEMQFARTPFCVSFQAGWFKFNLTTVHIIYGSGESKPRRLKEIDALAKFLTKRAKKEKVNYVLLGDFNIPKKDGDHMNALTSNGFHIPEAIKNHPTDLGGTYHYDQICFNLQMNKTMQVFDEEKQRSGAFNFTKSVYTEADFPVYRPFLKKETTNKKGETHVYTEEELLNNYMKSYRTFEMSDHLPLWVEFKVDFSGQYLTDLSKDL